MQSKNVMNQEFQMMGTLRTLAQAYEEISVIRIQRVRGSVLTMRDFLVGIAEIFKDVQRSYREEVEHLVKHNKHASETLSGTQKNGKTAVILLSSNNKLYGDIVSRVFSLFLDYIKKNECDIVVVGKVGKQMLQQNNVNRPYTYFDLPDENSKFSDLAPLIQYIVQYKKIFVYYGRFLNIVTQEPAVSEVLGEDSILNETAQEDNASEKDTSRYFFEPNLKKILGFFEDQMLSSLLKQVVDESELSRLASRIKSMEDSLGSIAKQEALLKKKFNRNKRLVENNKQIERLSGIALWQAK